MELGSPNLLTSHQNKKQNEENPTGDPVYSSFSFYSGSPVHGIVPLAMWLLLSIKALLFRKNSSHEHNK